MERDYEYRPVLFFLATTVLTWIPWFVGVLVGSQEGMEGYGSLFNLLGLLAPLAVSLFLILGSGNRALKSDLKDRIFNLRRIRPVYLIIAMAMPPMVMFVAMWLSLRLGQSRDQFQLSGGGNLVAMIILTMILAPIIEEMGWRGYGVDSLRARMGMLRASVLFGVLWSLWHAPLVLIPGTYHHELATMENPLFLVNFFVSVIPAAIIANWLYYQNNRSIVVGILFHSMLNATAVLLNAGQVTKCIVTLLFTLIAAVIVAIDRATFGNGPRNFLRDGSSGYPGTPAIIPGVGPPRRVQ